MKKLIKILPIVMAVMMTIMTASPVFALAFTPNPNTNLNGAGNSLGSVGNSILGILQIVGSIVAVAVIMVLGIKYMMGSAEEKAEYKKTFIPYIVGAVLLFAGVNIASAVVNMVSGI